MPHMPPEWRPVGLMLLILVVAGLLLCWLVW
jgi:hypothetical protein